MATRKRHKLTREEDLATMVEMYVRGYTQKEIGEKLGVCRQQIGYDLRDLQQRWRDSQLASINEVTVRQLEIIDAAEQEAWAAWRRSIGKKTKTKVTKGKDESKETMAWHDAGDAKFLTVILTCVEKRCAIFGIEAPKKFAPTDPTGTKPYQVAVSDLSDDELRIVQNMKRIAAGETAETN